MPQVAIASVEMPTWQELGLSQFEPIARPLLYLKDLPETARTMQVCLGDDLGVDLGESSRRFPSAQSNLSEVTLRVHLKSASGLMAADRGGTSDPYVKMVLLDQTHISKAKFVPRCAAMRRDRDATDLGPISRDLTSLRSHLAGDCEDARPAVGRGPQLCGVAPICATGEAPG